MPDVQGVQVSSRGQGGFTAVELLIAVALGGVLVAISLFALAGCVKKVKNAEAEVSLNVIAQASLREYTEHQHYVTGHQGATPAQPCCAQNVGGKKQCAAMAADWDSSPTWKALGFKQTQPFYFQYAYTGGQGGVQYEVTASGNLDCDENSIMYTLYGAVSGGKPVAVISKPTVSD